MPTRPCSIASAPTAGTDGCTCPNGALHTRNNRARSIKADFGPKKQLLSASGCFRPKIRTHGPTKRCRSSGQLGQHAPGTEAGAPASACAPPFQRTHARQWAFTATKNIGVGPTPTRTARMHPPRRLTRPLSAPARRPDLRDRKWPCRHARVRPGTVARRSGARTTLPAGGTHAAAAQSR